MIRREKCLRMAAVLFMAAVVSLCCPFVSLADSTGTVSVESAKIRGSADTDSNVVGSLARGAAVTIKEEVTDASGTLWYQIYVDANTTGYVRADLVNKEAGSDSGTPQSPSDGGAESTGQQTDTASGASSAAETAMDAQYASVSVEAAKIRSAPSTNDSVVERLEKGAQVTVTGQSNGSSDGKVWYYVTFNGADGTPKTGYVRSDLVALGDMVPVPEEQPAPEEPAEPAPEETFSQDYELVFKDGEWYLIDNISGGYEQKLQPLLEANQFQNDTMSEDAKKLVRQRIAIVVLGVLAAVLLVVIIIMAIKLRDAYYEDYEDEDEEDEEDEDEDDGQLDDDDDEDEEMPVRRRRRAREDDADGDQERPSRRSQEPEAASRRPVRTTDARQEQEQRTKPGTKRKAKNFLLDDDDFEFEFLNMDDKDL